MSFPDETFRRSVGIGIFVIVGIMVFCCFITVKLCCDNETVDDKSYLRKKKQRGSKLLFYNDFPEGRGSLVHATSGLSDPNTFETGRRNSIVLNARRPSVLAIRKPSSPDALKIGGAKNARTPNLITIKSPSPGNSPKFGSNLMVENEKSISDSKKSPNKKLRTVTKKISVHATDFKAVAAANLETLVGYSESKRKNKIIASNISIGPAKPDHLKKHGKSHSSGNLLAKKKMKI